MFMARSGCWTRSGAAPGAACKENLADCKEISPDVNIALCLGRANLVECDRRGEVLQCCSAVPQYCTRTKFVPQSVTVATTSPLRRAPSHVSAAISPLRRAPSHVSAAISSLRRAPNHSAALLEGFAPDAERLALLRFVIATCAEPFRCTAGRVCGRRGEACSGVIRRCCPHIRCHWATSDDVRHISPETSGERFRTSPNLICEHGHLHLTTRIVAPNVEPKENHMTTTRRMIPSAEGQFDAWVRNFVHIIKESPDTYRVDSAEVKEFSRLLSAWDGHYAAAIAARDNARAATAVKDESRQVLEELIRSAAKRIQADSRVSNHARAEAARGQGRWLSPGNHGTRRRSGRP